VYSKAGYALMPVRPTWRTPKWGWEHAHGEAFDDHWDYEHHDLSRKNQQLRERSNTILDKAEADET